MNFPRAPRQRRSLFGAGKPSQRRAVSVPKQRRKDPVCKATRTANIKRQKPAVFHLLRGQLRQTLFRRIAAGKQEQLFPRARYGDVKHAQLFRKLIPRRFQLDRIISRRRKARSADRILPFQTDAKLRVDQQISHL